MKFIYKTLNNIQTNLITYGNPFNSGGKDVIICITGNPGIVDFYIEFSQELYKNTNLPVCVVGHAGHDEVPDKRSNNLHGQEYLFNLKGQLKHKLDLLINHIDNKSRLHFIGHSIGSWFIIELLQNNDYLYDRTASINLLFPTIQKMAESKNGMWLNNLIRKIHTIVLLLLTLIHFLPKSTRLFLINIYLRFSSLPTNYNGSVLKYLNPKVCEKVLFLAYDEMDTVTTLNNKGMEKIKHLTNVIYSADDGWAPQSYMKDLTIYEPHLAMNQVNADHAFVLKSSESIALMTSDFIKAKICMNS